MFCSEPVPDRFETIANARQYATPSVAERWASAA
jgi:hypothetical protein